MYQFDSRIRYSEVDSQKNLTWASLLNYFQDCSVFHSENVGRGVDYLKQHHMAWVLSSWQVCLNDFPELMEHVWIQTWPYEMKAFYGYRNFRMNHEDGTCAAYANSVWVLIDTQSGRPVRVPEEIQNAYEMDERLPMECSGRKIPIPENMVSTRSITVPAEFIDTNQHMNNERYVMLALESLPQTFQTAELRVEYRKAAKLGDHLSIFSHVTENQVTVLLADDEQKPYAVVVFLHADGR